MSSVQLQFHGEQSELVRLAEEWASRHGLYAAVVRFFPEYEVSAVPPGQPLAPVAQRLGAVDQICLRRTEPDVDAHRTQAFLAKNPDCLIISVGPHTEDGLRESALSAVTDDQETLRLWRSLIRNAKSRMHSGATVVNPHTGARQCSVPSRHTEGAHRLAANGVTMLAAAGWVEYEFDDVQRTADRDTLS